MAAVGGGAWWPIVMINDGGWLGLAMSTNGGWQWRLTLVGNSGP